MSQIDFFQAIKHNWLVCKDCKDITAESSTTQHRIVILDICIISRKRGIKNTCKRGVWRVEREKGIVIKSKTNGGMHRFNKLFERKDVVTTFDKGIKI